MFGNTVRIILALVYLYAGGALLLGRKRFKEEEKEPNFIIPESFSFPSIRIRITTLVNW